VSFYEQYFLLLQLNWDEERFRDSMLADNLAK
jgi:hypothetical protein